MLKNKALLLPVVWIIVWLLPWGKFLSAVSAWVSLGIALLLFIVPGYCTSEWLLGDRMRRPMHALIGFALSNFIVAVLGITARLIHLPFGFIHYSFGLIGLIVIVISVRDRRGRIFRRPALDPKPAVIILLIAASFTIFVTLFAYAGDTFIVSDDASYLAYITNWQHSDHLDYSEVIYGSGNTDSIRFWLSYFPMTLALVSSLSGLHGILLIGIYLEPLLLILAILALYEMGLAFGLSPLRSAASILFLLAFYFYMVTLSQPGSAFYKRLSEDKVFATYVLLPAFFQIFMLYFKDRDRRSALLILLVGFSLVLSHPIVFFYAAIVCGIYAVITAWLIKQWKPLILGAVLLILIAAPIAFLRFVDHPSNRYAFDAQSALDLRSTKGLVQILDGSIFYGFNPAIMKIELPFSSGTKPLDWVLNWSYLWVLCGAVLWSLFHLRNSELARYILACALLVALAGIPYTGWMIGWLVSARMLWRSIWLFPIGMACTIILVPITETLLVRTKNNSASLQARTDRILLAGALILSVALIIPSAMHDKEWLSISELIRKERLLSDLASAGNYLEKLPEPVRVIGLGPLNSSVPGLSSRSKALVFRTEGALSFNYFLSDAEWATRDAAMTAILSSNTTREQRKQLMRKYEVEYILTSITKENSFAGDLDYNVVSFGSIFLVQYVP